MKKIVKGKKNTSIFIFGSCVTRDAFEFVKNNYSIVKYISRISLATAFQEKTVLSKQKFKNFKDIAIIPEDDDVSKFHLKCLSIDFFKNSYKYISEKKFDIFIIDLIDERFKIASKDNSLHTYSVLGKKIHHHFGYQVILHGFDSDFKFAKWKEGVDILYGILLSKNCKIVLNKVFWAKSCNDTTMDIDIDIINRSNLLLSKMYQYIEENYKERTHIIEYDESLFVSDVNHKWGHAAFHYTSPAYEHFISQLTEISTH
jgi:hypothetical protein